MLFRSWHEHTNEAAQAIDMIERLKTITRDANVRRLMDARIARLHGLQLLQNAAQVYRQKHAAPLTSLEQLVEAGLLPAVPDDPLGLGYELDAAGIPQLATQKGATK